MNDLRFENFAAGYLNDQFLDGTDRGLHGKDLNISKSTETPVNRYALLQAEKRFGNGDGIYTVDEQVNMVKQLYR